MRLAKYLSAGGAASRRKSERLILEGRVTVDGQVVRDPAHDVSVERRVELDGAPITLPAPEELRYIMLHKPPGVLTTMACGRERGVCVADLVRVEVRLHPVGRLDRDSSGLLLLTNDGHLTSLLTHPRHRVRKEYLLRLDRPLKGRDLAALERGVVIDDRAVEIDAIAPARGGRVSVTIHEGRRRILRRLFRKLGLKVIELKRVKVGPLPLGRLGVGRWRKLREGEILLLKRELGMEQS